MAVEVRSSGEPVGVMIRSKPDHLERFENREAAWKAIDRNWHNYQFTILSIADHRDGTVMFRPAIAAEIERRRAARIAHSAPAASN